MVISLADGGAVALELHALNLLAGRVVIPLGALRRRAGNAATRVKIKALEIPGGRIVVVLGGNIMATLVHLRHRSALGPALELIRKRRPTRIVAGIDLG